MVTSAALAIWMNGQHVGVWERASGEHRFRYDDAWLQSPAARVLSLSMPFTPGNALHRGAVVQNYFDNLLPDNDTIRQRLREKFSARSAQAFDLLQAIGRECVGAIQILPPGLAPKGYNRIESEPLDDAGVERAIAGALSGARVLGQRDDDEFRISIAGAQEKTALLRHEGHWCRPLGATPTTHILKLPLGLVGNLQADMRDSVENEWLCAQIMNAFGLPTAACEVLNFGARKVLVVERFDRALQPAGRGKAWIARLPQEDFCQALGVAGALKYESDGGPGMRDILRVLDASSNALADKRNFIKAQIVFWLLAATDGHAKNFSIFHERGGGYRLTPFYDVLSAWPIMGKGANQMDWHKARLAMAVRNKNVHWKLAEIQPRHWDTVARQAGLGDASALRAEVIDAASGVLHRVAATLPVGFPAQVAGPIFSGIEASALRLANIGRTGSRVASR
jgi:serine/threonine-protein kinase HipA